MNLNFSSGSFQLNTFQMFGMSEANFTNTVMAGFGSVGSTEGASLINFASAFQLSAQAGNMILSGSVSFTLGAVPRPEVELSGAPAGKGLQKDPPGWPAGSVRTAGGYTVVPEGNTSWKVFNPGQKPTDKPATHVHGDPHVTEADGGKWDFTKSSDFVLPDGTRIAAQTSSEKGYSVTTGLDITNGTDHVSVTNLDKKPSVSGVKQDGYEWRAAHMAENPGRDTFKLGGDGDDWFLVRGGRNQGEITGAHMDAKTGAYEQSVNGQPYRIDPNLRPPFGSNAWGNMLRDNVLDFVSGRFGMDPGSAAMLGSVFHADHLLTQMFGGGYLPQTAAGGGGIPQGGADQANMAEYLSLLWSSMQSQAAPPGMFGGMGGGMGFGLPDGMKALGNMSQVLNSMRSLGQFANIAQALAGAGGFMPPGGQGPFGPTGGFVPPPIKPHLPQYFDQSAGAAIDALKNKPGPITGDDMMKAILAGTADLDNQAAGAEFADFKKFAQENWGRMTPDAKAKFEVYEKAAHKAQAQGQTGIPIGEYAKMAGDMAKAGYKDSGAGAAIENLKQQPKPITGEAMEKAIIDGTKDLDNQAAGKEFADFKKYAKENWDNLSPEARKKFQTYEKYASAAQAKGQTGIAVGDYEKMKTEMRAQSYNDAGAGQALENLKQQPRPISGEAMEKAIIDGTKDLDGQAAGKEFADISKFAKENWDQLSPDAKAKYGVYEKYAKDAQAKGQTGIKVADYDKMQAEMKTAGYKDTGAGAAIENLKQQKTPISGEAMEKAIIDGTKDFDNQAAGKEFADFQKFAKENWNSLSPDAKAKYEVYAKHAEANKAKGNTGIPVQEYEQMKAEMKGAGYQDQGAGAAVENLKQQPKPISGEALEKAIIDGTKDFDNQAAGKEYNDLSKYVKENWNNLSPDAQAKWGVYEKHAEANRAKGNTGIPVQEYNQMKAEMRRTGYADPGAGAAIENLKKQPQPISGEAMERAIINGTQDFDNQAAGKEFADFQKYAKENWDKMSPDAQAKFQVYEKYAQAAQAKGQTGIKASEYEKMKGEMKTAGYQDAGAGAAIQDLKNQPKPISGEAMEKAIIEGTKDFDNQAAGKEFADFQKYAKENWKDLSPEAKAKYQVYEKHAEQNRAKGNTGIPVQEYEQMKAEMKTAGYKDAGAGAAIEGLKGQPKPISGEAMEKAIVDGTADFDNQAAGKEFADFEKFAKENWNDLSPDAKAKYEVYAKHAKANQAKGNTGIPVAEYEQMKAEMKTAGYKDAGAGAAVEGLKQQPKPISGAAMEKAIIDGTADLDGQAAGKEYDDLSKYVKENWNNLSPDAQAKWGVYEKHAEANRAKGNTGIPVAEYNQMKNEMRAAGYKDAGAGAAIEGLKQGAQPVSGADMEKAIIDGTKDLDGQAAGKEFADFAKYAKENWNNLSPDAKAKYQVYEKYAQAARAKGQSGINVADYDKMKAEMKTAGYQDAGAGSAIAGLKDGPRPISGDAMEKAIIDGTKDLDNQAAGKEFADFQKFAKEHWNELSPEAKAKYEVYEKHAQRNQARGNTGIPVGEYERMKAEMHTAGYRDAGAGAAIAELKDKPGVISGRDFENALIKGTADLDGQAAGNEYADFKKFATENWGRMSPSARAKFEMYEGFAQAAQARGMTGIPVNEYAAMIAAMKTID
ncbi:MAG: DUF1521 domain-containing protein [Pseudomonadota bacterium]